MKLPFAFVVVLWLASTHGVAQGTLNVKGRVVDAKTNQPLVNASIGLKNGGFNTATDADGNFKLRLPGNIPDDTLFVSYVGYATFLTRLFPLDLAPKTISLIESTTLLDEVTILERKMYRFERKQLEDAMKLVKGNLYAAETEVTNKEYNQFLGDLLRSNQKSLYEKYKPDFTRYEGAMLAFFKGYHRSRLESNETRYDKNYDDYPVVNISYEAVVAYCEWFTELYTKGDGKRKYANVRFRLPDLKEWQIAALGYKKFQSWVLEENVVEVGIPKHPGEEVAVKKRLIAVKDSDILYPWFGVHDYRNRAQNNKNCWLGNFKIPTGSAQCVAMPPAEDGYAVTGKVASYFPNGMGLYDVVGNVAEMIAVKGIACGGSWDHFPVESTIVSQYHYSGSDGAVGFRIFMEVMTEK